MKKTTLILVLLIGILAIGCAADTQTDETQNEVEDQLVFEDEDTTIQTDDAEVQVEVQPTQDLQESASLEEWCIAGEIYSMDDEAIEISSQIVGITTRDGVRVCQASQSQVMDLPMVGEMEINTEYFISEDQTEIWGTVETMGEIEEFYVNLNEI